MRHSRTAGFLGLLGFLILVAGIAFLLDWNKVLELKRNIFEGEYLRRPAERNTSFSSTTMTSHDRSITEDTVFIPDDVTLNNMSETQHMVVYQRYINTLQILCRNVIRIGSYRDGGKEICVDKAYRPKAPCLVYSFGINNQWDFDNMVVESFGCDVHCFDPSMRKKTGQVSANVWFYNTGLGDRDWVNEKRWDMRTLQTIRKDLHHENTTIDILKFDIEGDEWWAIPQMVKSGTLANVKQIAVETHFSRKSGRPGQPFWGNIPTNRHLASLRMLFEAGFRIFMRERNLGHLQKWPQFEKPLTNMYEISLLNQRYYIS